MIRFNYSSFGSLLRNFNRRSFATLHNTSKTTESPFKLVKDPKSLLPILESRGIKSHQFYNIALKSVRFPTELKIYSLGDPNHDALFLSVYDREDYYGRDMSLSFPQDFKITQDVIKAFEDHAPFDWTKTYNFTTVDRDYSKFISDLSIGSKGNYTQIYPAYMLEYPQDYYANLEIPESPVTKMSPIGLHEGLLFFMGTRLQGKEWAFTKKDSGQHMKRILERCESGGLYLEDKLISGCTFSGNGFGLLSQHYVLPEYRRRGYGRPSADYVNRAAARNGFKVVGAVEIHNYASIDLCGKRKGKITHLADYIFHVPHSYG